MITPTPHHILDRCSLWATGKVIGLQRRCPALRLGETADCGPFLASIERFCLRTSGTGHYAQFVMRGVGSTAGSRKIVVLAVAAVAAPELPVVDHEPDAL